MGRAPQGVRRAQAGAGGHRGGDHRLLKEHIARFKAPAVEFTELPKTSTGKVQKFVLRDKEWAEREKQVN